MLKEKGVLTKVTEKDLEILQTNPEKFWEGVNTIGDVAFSSLPIGKIKIPEGITKIESFAFKNCSSLTEIEIPDSVNNIGAGLFSDCTNLRKVKLPKNLEYIPHVLFSGCSSLTEIEIPDSVNEIWGEAFIGCTNLTKVKLPKNLKEIWYRLFSGCSSLTEIEIPDGVTRIEESSFENCASLSEIEIPDSVKYLGVAAFKDCKNLKKVKIPSGVTSIHYSTFANCSSLTEIEIPDTVEEIADKTFLGCQNLSKVKLPKGIKSLGDNIFNGCSNLTEVYLPDDLTYFEKDTFANIPNNVTFHYKGETLSEKIFPITYQLNSLLRYASKQDRKLKAKEFACNFDDYWLISGPIEPESTSFNPKLWKKLTDRLSQNDKDVELYNYQTLFILARNIGLFDEERMMTIMNGEGKDTQAHVNELAFNFLQKFTKDVPINRMHKYLSNMQAKGINEEFLKFISDEANYDEIISKIEQNENILTNLYDWFNEREKLKNLTDIERDDNSTNLPTSEINRYKIRTYEMGENGIEKMRWETPTVELIIKELEQKRLDEEKDFDTERE